MPVEGLPAPAWAEGYVHALPAGPALDFRERAEPADFCVEELPLEQPSGVGGHAWIEIEKRGLSTPEAVALLAAELGVPSGTVRYAGLKDKQAVARQWLSVGGLDPARALGLELPGLTVLRAARHGEPARPGRSAGNRFRLRLRGLPLEQRPLLEQRLSRIAQEGLANYYGAQRFGGAGKGHLLGRLLLERRLREYLCALASPEQFAPSPALAELAERLARGSASALRGLGSLAPRLPSELRALARELARWRKIEAPVLAALPVEWVRMHLSAAQSRVFNRVLAERLTGAGIDAPMEGDLCADGRPTGPLPGWRMERASADPGRLEAEVWTAEGAPPESFRGLGRGLDRLGARRALRVAVRGLEVEHEGDSAVLSFELPPGSYATTLLEELSRRLLPGRP